MQALQRSEIPDFALPISTLFQGLMVGESECILVHGKAGTGKTALVDYVLFQYAKLLQNKFSGGIFRLQYGRDDSLITQSQKDLLRSLVPCNQEV
jgi:predicted ATPase